MKKIGMAMVMLLALGLVFTSCKQQDADMDMTEKDLESTEWLIGKWEKKTEYDYKIEGVPDAIKKAFRERLPKPKTEEIEVTSADVDFFATKLRAYILSAGKEVDVPGVGKSKVSVKINKDKTKVSVYTDSTSNVDFMGNKLSVTTSIGVIYTKKK